MNVYSVKLGLVNNDSKSTILEIVSGLKKVTIPSGIMHI